LNTESNKALKKTGTINNWQQIIIMSNDKQECYSKRLNCDCPTLAIFVITELTVATLFAWILKVQHQMC
jgi:hypothetical protein